MSYVDFESIKFPSFNTEMEYFWGNFRKTWNLEFSYFWQDLRHKINKIRILNEI